MCDLDLDICDSVTVESFLLNYLPDDDPDTLKRIAKIIKEEYHITEIVELESIDERERVFGELTSKYQDLFSQSRVGAINTAIDEFFDIEH